VRMLFVLVLLAGCLPTHNGNPMRRDIDLGGEFVIMSSSSVSQVNSPTTVAPVNSVTPCEK